MLTLLGSSLHSRTTVYIPMKSCTFLSVQASFLHSLQKESSSAIQEFSHFWADFGASERIDYMIFAQLQIRLLNGHFESYRVRRLVDMPGITHILPRFVDVKPTPSTGSYELATNDASHPNAYDAPR